MIQSAVAHGIPPRYQVREYETLGLLGIGGSAVVFAATQQRLDREFGVNRKVALKFIGDLARARDELKKPASLDANSGGSV